MPRYTEIQFSYDLHQLSDGKAPLVVLNWRAPCRRVAAPIPIPLKLRIQLFVAFGLLRQTLSGNLNES